MTELVRYLLGLQKSPEWTTGGAWTLQFGAVPQGLWAVACVLLLVLSAVGVVWLYRREGRTISTAMRLLLCGLRLGILACVVLMLFELVLVITKREQVPSRMVVLVDTSESMRLSDPYTDANVAKKTSLALGLKDEKQQPDITDLRKRQRLDLAQRALENVLPLLADGREVSVYGFAGKLEPLDSPDAVDSLQPTGVDTALGDAVKNALAAHRGQPISGVLVATDGRSNVGDDVRKVAEQAGKDGVPIVSLAVGTEQGPSNARLVDIEASPIVFVRDPTDIAVLVEARGLQGATGIVTLEQRQGDGPWTEIGREEIVLGEDAAIKRSTFRFTSDATGQFDFRARISDVGTELTDTDNIALKSIKVVRQKIRTLLIAGYPSPEVQFLRNAMLRDTSLEFSSWLQSADDAYEQVGHRPLRRLPANRQELDSYDVIVLFDPDMRALGSAWPEMLLKFVGDAGGGLIYVAGELNTQNLFAGGSADPGDDNAASLGGLDNSWLRSLPVATDPGLYQSAADVRLSSRDTFNLELSTEGNNDPVFRFAPDPNRNREILTSLPGMYWHFPVTRAKPGATVLARHGDPRMRNAHGRHVLLATQRYGPGRTVFIGFDSTFRWRYLHEEYFDGFWARLIDRVGRSKVLGGRYPFTLSTDKSVYRSGDRVTLRATMVASGEDTTPLGELRGEVELTGQPAIPFTLEPAADQPGVLETTFPVEEAGAYLVRVVPAAPSGDTDAALRPATLPLRVEPPRQELDQPTLDRAVLDDIARASDGAVFTLAEFRDLPDAFKVKRVERVLEYRDELWDAPLLFGGMLLLLTIEWVLRKRCRMA